MKIQTRLKKNVWIYFTTRYFNNINVAIYIQVLIYYIDFHLFLINFILMLKYNLIQVQKARDSGSIIARELVAEAERLEVKSKATLVLAELLFDDKIHLQVNIVFINDSTTI